MNVFTDSKILIRKGNQYYRYFKLKNTNNNQILNILVYKKDGKAAASFSVGECPKKLTEMLGQLKKHHLEWRKSNKGPNIIATDINGQVKEEGLDNFKKIDISTDFNGNLNYAVSKKLDVTG